MIHRVIVRDKEDNPKEYAILVTDRRSIFLRQKKTRRSFVLSYEMKIGTALVTDVTPKSLQDYAETSLESLSNDGANITIPHESVISLDFRADKLQKRKRDFMLWFIMKMQKETFQVYNFKITYFEGEDQQKNTFKFYAVPLGEYFKPRRQVQNRETILREYANDILEVFRSVLPSEKISN